MEQDILNAIEKYRKYFELWKADVAIGMKGSYISGQKMICCFSYCTKSK